MFAKLNDLLSKKSAKYTLVVISVIALILCVLIMQPGVERFIMRFTEEVLLHRQLAIQERWFDYLFSSGYNCFTLLVLLLIVLFARKNPVGYLCLLIVCFILSIFFYRLFSASHEELDRLRFPFYVLAAAILIHLVKHRELFRPITAGFGKISNPIAQSKVASRDLFVFICGGLLGILFFIFTFGTAILDFTHTDWLMTRGDRSQHYLGWRMFRNSPWYFPIGLMDNIIYPFKESIIFMDSIPLFAVVFKLLSPILPENFQYFGLFGIMCYALQGGVGAVLVKRIGGTAVHAIIGAAFFILSTTMMWRMYAHTSLAAHFIILLTMLVCLKKPVANYKTDILAWSGLLSLAASIHFYFVPMVMFFMFFYLLRNYLVSKKLKPQLLIAGISVAALFVTTFCLGGFYSHVTAWHKIGAFSANLNAFFNPQGKSRFLKDLPSIGGQYEGLSYIGLGVILMVVMMLTVQLYRPDRFQLKELLNPLKTAPYAIGVVLTSLLFALSPVITLGQYKLFTYPVLPPIEIIWGVFSSTGRYTWPIMYICILFCLFWIIKNFSLRKGIALFVVLAVLQGADLADYFISKGNGFKGKAAWQTALTSPVWSDLAKEYNHIFFLGDGFDWFSFLDLAANNDIDVNDAYLARKNAAAINDNKRQEIAYLEQNGAKNDMLYIFADKEQAESLRVTALYLYDIDGVIIGIGSRPDYLNKYALSF
jgi:hypothetical protein